jgi:hypothetical protein
MRRRAQWRFMSALSFLILLSEVRTVGAYDMPLKRDATSSAMSPQESQRLQEMRGLFLGRVHFRMPSAEDTFAFPHEAGPNEEAISAAVIKKASTSSPK